MKKSFLCFLILVIVKFITSCKKEDTGELPEIRFKEGNVLNSSGMYYTCIDTTIDQAQNVVIGVVAEKKEKTDYLTRFDVYKTYDEGTRELYYSKELTGAERDFYSCDIYFITRNQTGTERWTFMVLNRNGLYTRKEIFLKVE